VWVWALAAVVPLVVAMAVTKLPGTKAAGLALGLVTLVDPWPVPRMASSQPPPLQARLDRGRVFERPDWLEAGL
jgi:hypothetical protein